ncbi:tetratricopeptide repeat protein [Pedobacter sp. P351]|uniref:tetratricopeptide repeat protein n=1 Tax=Pedobacter superstes TaxID=3133441 RepID=UPI0030B174C3
MKMIKKGVKTSLVIALMGGTSVFAQSITDVKQAIDAEQYQKANTTLKGMISAKPADAPNYFYLGNLYLNSGYADSAQTTFSKGISADGKYPLNYVGLGALALRANNTALAEENFKKAIDQAGKKDNDPYIYVAKAYVAAPKPNYAAAITHLQKAIALDAKDAEAYLALGDAYRGQEKISEAFSAYRTAFDLNKNLLRAKIELGVINKRAQAWQESLDEFNSVLKINPNYGPAYREMAETYLRWANTATETADYESRIKNALNSYVKYMDLTDRSMDSRMRYADFLVLSKDFKTLEKEAQEMARLDQTNPRIYRYLGYSAYENGHYAESLKALNNWISKVDKDRLIAHDYLYLGKAQMKTDTTNMATGIQNLAKAIELDSTLAEQMSAIGKDLFAAKKYDEAAQVYELALKGPKPSVTDRFYIGYSHYFNYIFNVPADKKAQFKSSLVRADTAFNNVNKVVPTYALAYIYRARINKLMDDDQSPKGLAVPYYEKFIEIQAAAPAQNENNKKDLIESYNYLANYYSKNDTNKSKELLKKTLALDPANEYATAALKALASQ